MRLARSHRLAVAVLALGLALAFASPAAAGDFTVNDAGDSGGDLVPGDELCDKDSGTTGQQCTFRTAVEEANGDSDDVDRIGFDVAVRGQTTTVGSTIDITQPVTINACTTDGSIDTTTDGPCAGFRTNDTTLNTDVLAVSGNDVFVRGLALTNGRRGIFMSSGTSGLKVENSYFGIKVDDTTVEANSTGIGLTGSSSTIGGDVAAERNVFVIGTGVQVFTGDDNQILGNYFGTMPNGVDAVASGPAVTVRGNDPGGDIPDRTIIGGTLSAAQRDSAACDGPCNVIANAVGAGIDLGADVVGSSAGANVTSIKGNHIGIDATGNTSAGNSSGVAVRDSDGTTIGGPLNTDRNVIGGNDQAGVDGLTGGVQGNLLIKNNFLGLNSVGTQALPDTNFAARLGGGTFSNNRLGGDATFPAQTALALLAPGPTTVQANIFGVPLSGIADVGLPDNAILVGSENNVIGGDGGPEANTIHNTRNADSAAVLVQEDGATIQKNDIRHGDDAGIRIDAGADGTVIGDPDPSKSPLVAENAGNALELRQEGTEETDENLIAQILGFSNGGLMIDLGDDGVGNAATGPNDGVQAPVITEALIGNPGNIAGTADPGATVRLYAREAPNSPGQADELRHTVTADAGGNWSSDDLILTQNQPNRRIVATQTRQGTQNTSEFSEEAVAQNLPAVPTITDSDPDPGANDNNPKIKGTADQDSTVNLYTNSACSGTPAATGTGADFASPGLPVSVPDNSSTTFFAQASREFTGPSACSSAGFTYNEITPGPVTTTPGTGAGGAPGSTFTPGPLIPNAAALLAALNGDLRELGRVLQRLGIQGVLRRRGASIQGDALTAGTERFDVFVTRATSISAAARTRILSGKRTFAGAGKARVRLKLTRKGRRLLRRTRRARLELRGSFTDRAGKRTAAKRRASLKRKGRRGR